MILETKEMLKYHTPVMLSETLAFLKPRPGGVFVDATCGTGGHSQAILEKITPGGKLIAIDRDEESLNISRQRLSGSGDACRFVHENFVNLDSVLHSLGIKKVSGVLFDLGISSFQLDDPGRGFSFQGEGPLDMRLDRTSFISAYDLVNNLNEDEISTLLWNFGEERWHNRIAHLLVEERKKHPIATTQELSDIVIRAMPAKYRFRHHRIHPATRTFQAVRIAVNRELEILEKSLEKAVEALEKGGRICVISFHSLEDRVVKHTFRRLHQEGVISILTPKPLTPAPSEVEANPRSRSSKFRAAERKR